jgi:hypothetical protein
MEIRVDTPGDNLEGPTSSDVSASLEALPDACAHATAVPTAPPFPRRDGFRTCDLSRVKRDEGGSDQPPEQGKLF